MTVLRTYPAPARRRRVIAEMRQPMRPISAEGVRWDVLVISLGLVLLLILGVMFSEAEALLAGGIGLAACRLGSNPWRVPILF